MQVLYIYIIRCSIVYVIIKGQRIGVFASELIVIVLNFMNLRKVTLSSILNYTFQFIVIIMLLFNFSFVNEIVYICI